MQPTKNHDGTDGGLDDGAPSNIGAVRSASETHVPQGGLGKPLAVAGTPFAATAVVTIHAMNQQPVPWIRPVVFGVGAIVFAAGIIVRYALNAGAIRTWVGDDGLAVGPRRVLDAGRVIRFVNVHEASLITSHFYAGAGMDSVDPLRTALLYRFDATDASRRILLRFQGRADYREPGRPDDDAPETFAHLPSSHGYWFARAAAAAWESYRTATR